MRSRLLPTRMVVYYVMGLCLFFSESYEEVIPLLVNGCGFSVHEEKTGLSLRQVPFPRHVGVWDRIHCAYCSKEWHCRALNGVCKEPDWASGD
ncbi:hypothetical protein SSP35_51_00030 [Streptomyces sp. NBRC 110611]|nr:hypothetical protein SSP35_51_00030 [Streptomyces sp. NBRC 110611]